LTIAEMEEIAGFVGEDDAGHQIFTETGALTKFLDQGK
jgi:hypothetical protein